LEVGHGDVELREALVLPDVESVGCVDNEAVVEEDADPSSSGVNFDGSVDEEALCELWKAVSIAVSIMAVLVKLQMLGLNL
jgi:hypothetical protein